MKIQCQSCQAKYTIADEKVLGKVVKIRCKKCGATIVINGNETRPAGEDNADTHVFDYASQSNEQWTVNVADGDQRTMTPQEIATEYKNGVVNDETFCWKDGMADWLPLREIEQLYGLAKMGPGRAAAMSFDEISVPPQSVPQPAPLFAETAVAAAPEASPFAGASSNGNGGALFGGGAAAEAAAAPAAARRGGRGQGADLFGNAATAGGEEDVMTSAASAKSAAAAPVGGGAGASAEKMTGQRNENSVLFSLSALTSTAKEEPSGGNKTTATADGSGLIDIRALSAGMGDEGKKKEAGNSSRVDDIMNLSGGGAFGAALAAPILAPPPLEAPDLGIAAAESPAKSAKTMMIAIIGAGALIAIGIIVAVVLITKQPANTGTAGLGSASPLGSGAMAGNDPVTTPTSTAAATATPSASVADNTPPPPGTGQAAGSPGAKPATGGTKPAGGGGATGGGALAAKDPTPSAPAAPAEPAKPSDLGSALAAAAGKKDDGPKGDTGGGGATAPFDRGAAAASLGGINVASCKKPDGPTGAGHVKVTFAPNGTVSSAVIDSGPFPGTPVGGCIAGKFRGAHVPAFAGGPVTVGKSFTIN